MGTIQVFSAPYEYAQLMSVQRARFVRFSRPLLLLLAVTSASFLLSACGSSSTASRPQASANDPVLKVLPPATVPPVVNECSQKLSYSADGNASPLTCTSGGLNVLSWKFYSTVGTNVMSLGHIDVASIGSYAAMQEIVGAICSDMQVDHATWPEAQNAAVLASNYYGWNEASQINSLSVAPC